ncbi:MAG: chemotaxis protein CheX [Arenicella sp.]
MIDDKEIQVFIDGTKHYFSTISDDAVVVGTPYLVDPKETPARDFTGIIGVSGARKGCVYFSAPKTMLRYLLSSIGETQISDELIHDIVGEVANTLSGNARDKFGAQFMISVPIVVQSLPDSIQLPTHLQAFVIPIEWQTLQAYLVVCLE